MQYKDLWCSVTRMCSLTCGLSSMYWFWICQGWLMFRVLAPRASSVYVPFNLVYVFHEIMIFGAWLSENLRGSGIRPAIYSSWMHWRRWCIWSNWALQQPLVRQLVWQPCKWCQYFCLMLKGRSGRDPCLMSQSADTTWQNYLFVAIKFPDAL